MANHTPSPLDDDALSAALRARGSSGEHLSEADWERLTCDEMTAAERDAALAHIMSCAECAVIHRGLLELRNESHAHAAPAPKRFTYGSWTVAGGLATAAAIVAALLINRPTRVDPDVMRSERDISAVVALTPAENAPLADRRFAWQAVAGADRYELRVTTQDGQPVFTSMRDETSAVLPNEIELSAGTYYWRVLAFKGDAELAASPLIPFVISRGR